MSKHVNVINGASLDHTVLSGHEVENVPHEQGVEVQHQAEGPHVQWAHVRVQKHKRVFVADQVLIFDGHVTCCEHDPVDSNANDVENSEPLHLLLKTIGWISWLSTVVRENGAGAFFVHRDIQVFPTGYYYGRS